MAAKVRLGKGVMAHQGYDNDLNFDEGHALAEMIDHTKKGFLASLNEWWPPRGPCSLCSDKDARHRIWDSIYERWIAGETFDELALDYDVPPLAIACVVSYVARCRSL